MQVKYIFENAKLKILLKTFIPIINYLADYVVQNNKLLYPSAHLTLIKKY